ncbi:hypothetical protein ACWOB1_01595 [Facklamia languida]|uniref:Uncharacterized protein n=1 Tax=Facklamia languida CCUG 37842 TaxID=883113 RepID=H3NH80_9LACT|nr:hypothetical protein [Facklamia languida]EHR38135.1 hypothetical protein HMPREF9708_00219 [Facklamia languida CCUG 37842]
MAKRKIYVEKKKGGCLKNALFIILVLVIVGYFFPQDEGNNTNDNQITQTEISTVSETHEKPTLKEDNTSPQETTQGQDEFGEPKSDTNYDISEVNEKIWDSLEESKEFAKTDPDYMYHAYIDSLEIQQTGALHVVVTDEFNYLSDEDKKLVLQTANNIAKLEVFMKTNEDNSLFITALNMSGEKIAQSKMTNFTEYKFN